MEGIKKDNIPKPKIKIPPHTKERLIPMLSAIKPVASNPSIDGKRLRLPKRENTLPKAEEGICICKRAVKGLL